MGVSVSKSTSNTNNTEFLSFERRRVPRHLRPLKGKSIERQLPRSDLEKQNSPCKDKISRADKQHTSTSNSINTLIPHENFRRLDELEQIFMDHSTSGPQMFRWIKGRRFQNSGDICYPLPNDQLEIDRQRVQLYIIRWAFESRHVVPPPIKQKLNEGIRVLNVGCGPGLWVGHPIIDMAEDFCNSTFDAVDVCNLIPRCQHSDRQTRSSNPLQQGPDNLKFSLHNILMEPLPYVSNIFDYVQQSITALAYRAEDWPNIVKELSRVTKPGGYIQLIEIEIYPYCSGPLGESWWNEILETIRFERGNDPGVATRLGDLLSDADLEDVNVRFVSIPIGSWGLDIGNLWKQNVYAFLDSAATFLIQLLGITNSEYKKRTQKFTEELDSGQYKAFSNIYVAYGRKKAITTDE